MMMYLSDKRASWWAGAVAACAVATGLTGCGEETPAPECTPGTVCGTSSGQDGGLAGTTTGVTVGTTGTSVGATAGTTTGGAGTTTGTTSSTTAGSTAGTTGTPSAAGNNLPCDVQAALTAKCGACHGAELGGGAPMSLASLADFMAPLPSNAAMTAAQGVSDRIQPADISRRMPPPGLPELTAEEMTALDTWLKGGTPGSSEVCEGGGDAGPGGTKAEHDPTLDCYEFRAHAPGNKDAKYKVGTARDKYINFTFNSPWEGTAYGREFNILLDNKAAVHHWLLFQNKTPGSDGEVDDSSGTHPDGELMYGWAPGGNSLNFAEFGDVGMVLNSNVSYTLELHYNSSDAAAEDMSGVEVCVTHDEVAEKAGTAWVGSDAIFGDSVTGTCKPAGQTEPIRILGISPHMHKTGRHMTSVIHRADGTDDMLHDMPFDFNYQTYYFLDEVLMPGDTIETTCKFSQFQTFGTGTDAEMCYMCTVHSPAGALTDNGPAGVFAHGENACLGL